MPIRDITSKDLWSEIEKHLNVNDEHVCVMPMTTFIKPVRVMTVIQTDTNVTAATTPCPEGSVNLPRPEPEPKPEVDPEPDPEPAPEPDPEPDPEPAPEPELGDPRIVPYAEMKEFVTKWAFDDELNAAYSRDSQLDVRSSSFGVMNKGTLTVGMDWRDNPAKGVIVQVNLESGKILAHKRGSTRYYFKVEEVEGTKFAFVGQSGRDEIDVEAFA